MSDDGAFDLKRWRKQTRDELVARRRALPAEVHQDWSETITAHLLGEFPTLRDLVLAIYWPIRGEFDPRFAARALRERGVRTVLPVVVQKNAPLQFREWWPGVTMVNGVFDVAVPEGTPLLVPQAMLIPPVGFDAAGYRLGYGAGFYDRTLAQLQPRPLTIAVAFELSRLPTIHPQPHDIPMDFIVTEAGVFPVRQTAAGHGACGEPVTGADTAGARFSSPVCYADEFRLYETDTDTSADTKADPEADTDRSGGAEPERKR